VIYPEPLSASNSTHKTSLKLIIHIIDKKGKEERKSRTTLFYTSERHSEITGTGSFGTIDQNILVSIVHLFDNIDKVSGHPDII